MAEVRPLFPGEHAEAMLKRLRKVMEREGLKTATRRHEFFKSPSQRRRAKSAAAQRRGK